MKKTFLALLVFGYILPISAQDSTSVRHAIDPLPPSSKMDTLSQTNHKGHFTQPYLLYNYTAQAGNTVLSQQFRPDADNRIIADGNFYSNSKGVPDGIGFALLFNRPISAALINRADKQLGKMIKFEENLNTGITYQRYLKKAGLTLVLGYNYRQMLNLSGPKQAFETIFYGNARFEGDTAHLSNVHFDFYNYNQYSLGLIKRVDYGNYQMEVGISGSFLQVIDNIDIQTGNTTIYTAPYGEYININYNLTYNTATTGSTHYGSLNGEGASGDFHLAVSNKDKWNVSLDVRDLGIMTFRKHEVNYSGANNVNFQGFVIPDLLHFTSATFDTLNLDSALLSKLPGKTNNLYSLFLPFTANLTISKPLLNDRLVLTAGVQYRNIPHYYAYGYLKANYFLKPDMLVSASAGAGGYSLFDLGFEFAKTWKYFDLAAGTSNLIGLVAPNFYSGGGLYLKLGATF